ncbi:MAG: RHS repeat-associated core domain-containing protein [Chitinophagaceae bacterium]
MMMQGRKFITTKLYRYGYNGMEHDTEINGEDNSYTTEYRAYDSRLGRWYSVDPKISMQPWESPYSAMNNSPLWRNDPNGDIAPIIIWAIKKLGEAAIGVMTDIAVQVAAEKYFGNNGNGHSTWTAAWNNLDIDQWQAIQSGSENLIKNKHLSAALSAGGDMLNYYYSDKNASWDGAMTRGGMGAISAYIGGNVSKYIGKYGVAPVARGLSKSFGYSASMLRSAGIELFSTGVSRVTKRVGNLDRHFKKHVLEKGSYNFKTADEFNEYGMGFFGRSGNNINEFTDAKGFVHRIDLKTQEYGVLAPEGGIQTVFKVQPGTKFKNATEYLEQQVDKYGHKDLKLDGKN